MYIEDRLNSIEAKLDFIVKNIGATAIPQDESGVAGAGADPVVAAKVDAIVQASVPQKRGRGRPPKSEPESGAPAAPPVSAAQSDPFALDGAPSAPAATPRTLTEVKAAMVAYQTQNSQEAALKLLKDTTGAETLAALAKADPATYAQLFKAAIPADKFALSDVRAVLVAAEGRKTGAGREVLAKFEAKSITDLKEDRFVDVILAAHTAGR